MNITKVDLMMIKKSIFAVTIIIIIGFGIIVSLPMLFLSIGFSAYDSIEHHKDYYYYNSSMNSAIKNSLDLNLDVGELEVNYIYSPVDYCIKIELNIELISQKNLGNSFLDYFEQPSWQNSSNSIKFTMRLKPEALVTWFNTSLWKEQEVIIIATINANFLFNINATIKHLGNVDILVPAAININNVDININQGNIYYDFFYSTIEGNVTGSTIFGDITLKGINVRYTKNSIISLINGDGLIKFDIIQERAMNVNLTGIGKTKTGQIKVIYHDSSENIGAKLTFHNYSGTWPGFYNYWVGFHEPESFYDLPDVGYIFTSFDYKTKGNYNFSLYRDFVSRPFPYTVDLSSIPKTL
jgi:hypothetical protein